MDIASVLPLRSSQPRARDLISVKGSGKKIEMCRRCYGVREEGPLIHSGEGQEMRETSPGGDIHAKL